MTNELIFLALGLAVGSIAAWLLQHFRLRPAPGHRPEEIAALEADRNQLRIELATLDSRLQGSNGEIESLKERSRSLDAELRSAASQIATQNSENRHLEKRLTENLEKHATIEKNLQDRFAALASSILDRTTAKFTESNTKKIETLLKPFRDQVEAFRKATDEKHLAETEGRGKLFNELKNLQQLNRQLSDDAHNLTSALKGETRTAGAWGEMILETILSKSGLTAGVEYETQRSFTGEDGKRQRPDVIIHYPEQKSSLVIDSKVSLTGYERYCSATDDDEKQRALKAHLTSVRTHIRQLGDKQYHDLPGVPGLEFVLMFIPIEHAFNAAIHEDPKLYDEAFERQVVLITPATLFATLKMVKSIWSQDRQSKHAIEIANRGGALVDKFISFYQTMTEIGTHLDRTKVAHEKALSQLHDGRGSLTAQARLLVDLGAKASKALPEVQEAPALDNGVAIVSTGREIDHNQPGSDPDPHACNATEDDHPARR